MAYPPRVGALSWLDRIAGRVNRWFGAAPAATQVGSPGIGTQQVSATGARVVADEIEKDTRPDLPDEPTSETPDDRPSA